MKITNTLTRQKEELVPINDKKINMFVCGPTVYDYIHIGNARTFVFFDVVTKYLKHKGFEVDYIQNITDIDNKIIERANKERIDSLEYTKKYTKTFKQNMKDLDVTTPKYKNATEHISDVIKQVQILLDKGNAYLIANDGIYFDLSTFPDYGKLSNRTASMADDAVSRIDDSDKKRNHGDFALWKFSQKGDPSWPASFGGGRPGWHIEDTAITEHYFGPQYDIHGGGQDLMFPHHEAEIAQQESASGLKPLVKYWMHVAFLINKDLKMSKSLGNFETVNNLLEKYSKEVLRFYLLSNHYRSPLDYNEDIFKQAQAAVSRISEFISRLDRVPDKPEKGVETTQYAIIDHYKEAMDDDFNTPKAIAAIFELIRLVNTDMAGNSMGKEGAKQIRDQLEEINSVLGIIPEKSDDIPEEVQKLIDKREELRQQKNWTEADKIRAQIQDLGYEIEDTIYGPLLRS